MSVQDDNGDDSVRLHLSDVNTCADTKHNVVNEFIVCSNA